MIKIRGATVAFLSLAVTAIAFQNCGKSGNSAQINSSNLSSSTGTESAFGANDVSGSIANSIHPRFDGSGNLYFFDLGSNSVKTLNMTDQALSTVVASTSLSSGQSPRSGIGGGDIITDTAGNLYISDTLYSVVVLYSPTKKTTKVVAGNWKNGYTGDGGLATTASLNSPSALALDSKGNLYIADLLNNCVRMVTKATGKISTVAGSGVAGYSGDGGLAKSAKLKLSPPLSGIAIDLSGNLYIADTGNAVIRKVTAATGKIATIAGGGISVGKDAGDGGKSLSARLILPNGIAVSSTHKLYIADAGDHRLRMVNLDTGIISTVAGTGVAGVSVSNTLATDALINQPSNVFVDKSGTVYFADSGNSLIRRIEPTSFILTTMVDVIAGLVSPQ